MRRFLIFISAVTLFAIAPAAAQPSLACRTIVMHPGSIFTITLSANRTTGYSWALEDPLNSSVVAYRSKLYASPTQGVMGGPGAEIWTFDAVGRGRALISLKYARPWEKSAPPAKEALYVVVVR